ncbi:hypothetical protein PLEOSDRAFT_1063919 [Pleurotus ostreatus PC15]|uniref:Gfo/Idh/MocA-like oxidoreductase N-terminal domain-containing protein n=1 Tax=Pleurotus ostreatus (strain PC15) TaxID=1137138 RepID=A0A067NM46_PLEO1|nr:hypothetical protein PLEOSDRAFT_1063919 [Pleurotus ostreatus PC15]
MSLLTSTRNFWRRSMRTKEIAGNAASALNSENVTAVGDPVTLVVIGCGQRGQSYSKYALTSPDKCRVVAIAEPRPKTQRNFAKTHNIDPTLVFETWQELHAASAETIQTVGKRLADAVIVAVQDYMHLEVTLAFAEQGYHILCEKPMATSIDDCLRMEAAVKKAGIIFGMGHVLRYSPYNKALSEIIHSGLLGRLINVVHMEPVGHYHFAHSFVRGNWGNEEKSSFSLMTKSCHDIDILCHWFSPASPARVTSFGSLQHFKKSEKPPGAGNTLRCLECPVENDCPYSAKKIYLDPVAHGNTGWPAETIVDGVPDIESITNALQNGPYGKCAYESDNDVCDHQVVNIEFSDGSTVSFTMVAFTSLICERQTRFHFSHGEIVGNMRNFTVTDFRKDTSKVYNPTNEGGGHGGGDLGLISSFIRAVREGRQEILGTDVGEILRSHLTVFAAEESRRKGVIINCAGFEQEAKERIESVQTV